MQTSLIIAGFGGQGVMLMGKLLGFAATKAGLNATFYPTYGPEQRGGTSNCSVIISDEEIGLPLVEKTDSLIVMNEPSYHQFQDRVKSGGNLLLNSSLIKPSSNNAEVNCLPIPINDLAIKMGSDKVANMIMLGLYMKTVDAIPCEFVISTIEEKLGKKADILKTNIEAFTYGFNFTAN